MVRVGNEEAESTYYSYVHSMQGDILGIIDRSQDLVVEYAYDPWGKLLEARSLITECEMLARLNPFRYRGYVFDDEISLYYLRSRYYNPEWGRFISKDVTPKGGNALFEYSLFCYTKNNPIIFVDKSGKREEMMDAPYSNSGFHTLMALLDRTNVKWIARYKRAEQIRKNLNIPPKAGLTITRGYRDYTAGDRLEEFIYLEVFGRVITKFSAFIGDIIGVARSASALKEASPNIGRYASISYEFTYTKTIEYGVDETHTVRDTYTVVITAHDYYDSEAKNDYMEYEMTDPTIGMLGGTYVD